MRSVGAKRPETHLPAPPERPIARPSCPKTDAKPGAAAAPRHAILRLLATGQSELDENGELCVLQGRLYLASLAGIPVATEKKYFVTLSKKMRYIPFCADFGPFNLGTLHHICQALVKALFNPEFQDVRIVYYTSQDPRDVTNVIYLLGAFLCLRLGATPEEAWGPFQSLKDTCNGPMCLPYRDATWVKSSYDLHVKDCWAGLVRAVATGLYDLQAFDKHEYFYYDNPANGDLHMVVPGKFLAFRGPRDDPQTHHQGCLLPSDYIDVFRMLKVSTIVRLNKAEYSRKSFTAAGFEHVDQVFEDCSVPPSNIVDSFLRRAEGLKPGAVMAVHCLAGLGRTGTLIALYMMKHFGFTANEAMGWLRICRPGSIIGPQQQFLVDQEDRMHRLGAAGVPGLGSLESTYSRTTSPSQYRSNDGISQSKVLSEMVTDGMLNRSSIRIKAPQPTSSREGAQVKRQQEAATRSCLPWLDQQSQKPSLTKKKEPSLQAKQLTTGGGMKRSVSGPSLAIAAAKKEGLRLHVSHVAPQRDVPQKGSAGFAGVHSLRKNGSFNNLSQATMNSLLSAASSDASTPRSSGSSARGEDDSDKDMDGFMRTHSDGEFERVGSGSLCFGGMEKLHRNVPAHLKQTVAGKLGFRWGLGQERGDNQGEGGQGRSGGDLSPISVFSRARLHWQSPPETN